MVSVGYILATTLKALGKLVKRKHNVWIFGAWAGQNYSDNTKYLFEYVNEHQKDIRAIWITKSEKVCWQVRQLGYQCYMEKSLKGMYYATVAGAAFETSSNDDISALVNNELTKTFMLWHGIGVKALKWEGKTFGEGCTKFKYDYFPATSELYIDVISPLMNVPREQFEITGYARNDMFIHKPKCPHVEELLSRFDGCKRIIYMPTHRNFGKAGNAFINIEEFKRIDAYLKDNQMVLVYKPHFHELANFAGVENEFSNIIFAKEDVWADPYAYLHYFDLLISDYSSCIFDFLCSDKPVVLFPYDIDSYQTGDAGLLDIYWDIPAGPMCYTWDEVLESAKQLTENEPEENVIKRRFCREKYHATNDGKNAQRVYAYAKNTLLRRK